MPVCIPMDPRAAPVPRACPRRAAAALLVALLACGWVTAFAQDPAEPDPAEEASAQSADGAASGAPEAAPDSTATDRAEDRYRASRELEEADRSRTPRRPNFTVPKASPDGFDRLPPESKQHLRDQLKQVIIANGEWSPEHAGETYPYVPSEGAMSDSALKQAEREAWGDMVADYHAREAEAHAARQAGASGGAEASAETGQGAGEAARSAAAAAARDSASLSPEALARQSAADELTGGGVSQSALDYLRAASDAAPRSNAAARSPQTEAGPARMSQAPPGGGAQAGEFQSRDMAQVASEETSEAAATTSEGATAGARASMSSEPSDASSPADESSASDASETSETSEASEISDSTDAAEAAEASAEGDTAMTVENEPARTPELRRETRPASDEETASEGVQESALDYLRGAGGTPAGAEPLPGLITIEDLSNAQGIGTTPPAEPEPVEDPASDQEPSPEDRRP